jgi:hypothetical protein|tara:strand:- start:1619 stop:1909 length:291 start_codon:yes stop_codon:yes gene_type:complete
MNRKSEIAHLVTLLGDALEALGPLSAALDRVKGKRKVDGRKQRLEFVMDVDEFTDVLNAYRTPVEELLEVVNSVERKQPRRVEGETGSRFQSIEID